MRASIDAIQLANYFKLQTQFASHPRLAGGSVAQLIAQILHRFAWIIENRKEFCKFTLSQSLCES